MSIKILIVDDSYSVRVAVGEVLEHKGFQVLYADNGKDGLGVLLDNPDIDVAFVDYNMPIMNGIEMIEGLRAETSALPELFMLTTETTKVLMEKAKTLGFSGWIIKPMKPAILDKLAKSFLEKNAGRAG